MTTSILYILERFRHAASVPIQVIDEQQDLRLALARKDPAFTRTKVIRATIRFSFSLVVIFT